MLFRSLVAALRSVTSLLTPAGWTSLGCGVVLTAFGLRWAHPGLVIVGVTLLGLAVGALLWMAKSARFDGHRSIEPASFEAGSPALARLVIENLSRRRSPRVLAVDHVNQAPLVVVVPAIEGGGVSTTTYEVPTAVRGVFRLGPLAVAHTDPFRLVQAGVGIGGQSSYRVWARTAAIPPLPSGRIRDLEGAATPRTAGSGVTFHTLRDYVPGDDRRQIHWRSSARTGSLMVRQNILTSEPQMVVFIDCFAQHYGSSADFENACSAAASLVRAGRSGGHPVELIASNGSKVKVDSSGGGVDQAFDLIAELQPRVKDASIHQLAWFTSRAHASSSLAVVTGDVDPRFAETLRTMQGRYAACNFIQIASEPITNSLTLPASLITIATDFDDFVRLWRQRVDR